jgi:hypothetical protein
VLLGEGPVMGKKLPFPKMTENGRPSPRQMRAIVALIGGKSIASAAAAASVSPRTLHTWRSDPTFATALQRARDEAFREALETLRRVAATAVATCEGLMAVKSDANVRLAAARTVLQVALRSHEQVVIEQRLAALEAKLGR